MHNLGNVSELTCVVDGVLNFVEVPRNMGVP